MTKSPTGIIPQRLNAPQDLPEVIKFLRSLNIPVEDRQEVLFGWARNVGLRIGGPDYRKLLD